MKRRTHLAVVAALAMSLAFAGTVVAKLAPTKGPHGEDATSAKSLS